MRRPLLWLVCALGLSGPALGDPQWPGGATSTPRQDIHAFAQPSANLDALRRLDFSVGNSFFRSPWVSAPASTTARDGLGPLFNASACISCHVRDGRGKPPAENALNSVGMLVRVSVKANASARGQLGVVPEPTYGVQLQDMAVPGVTPEAKVRVRYSEIEVTFADGFRLSLQKPELVISNLGYGPLHPDTEFSARIAPPMIGLGLLEAIDSASLLAKQDPQDLDGNGIRGQANWVWDAARNTYALGRFGWKAGQPTLAQQNAHAFANDLGLTSALIAQDDCTAAQRNCHSQPHGGQPEVSEKIANAVLFYTRNLAPPLRRNLHDARVQQGQALFHQAGCAACHTPSHRTRADAAEPELADQLIYPYTDLLLHDMGEGLADQRPEFAAHGSQWRTAPLWGIGLTQTVSGHQHYLHDGRARSLLEAIIWHGGEAEAAKQQVLHFNASERAALLAFLESL